ncbi:MAG TPA: hypothetical protein DF712_20750 [Balneola sp.]|nr:hypothetical protein [Balneola sp.]|tara:strand:- start:335 stop:580 length:246 start_codon:yes stop_codon:yes gene_type:complete
MTSLELTQWAAYYQESPFESEGHRGDMRQAITSAAIASLAGGDSDPKKYMPKYGNNNKETLIQNVQSFMSKMRNLQGSKNG